VMMRYLPIGVVVIDSSYRIVTVNATARRLLGIRDRGTEQDFLHSAKALPYAQVRGAIDTAFRERTAVTLEEVELEGSTGGEGRYCNLSILLMQFEPGFHNLATVTVSDTTEQVELSRRLAAMESEHTQLIGELSSANKRQGDINSELQEANEELQAANEELMLTQEEMQATNEEFEATNEELQATNEELETNNEELQATNEELQTTNDELSARTNELQEVTKLVSNERRRLTEMVEHLPQSILILSGPNLTVEAYNSKFALLIQGREVLGRPFDELFEGSDMAAFVEMVRESYRKDLSSETPQMLAHVRDERGDRVEQLFIHTITPIHDSTGKVDGIMIYTERAPSHDGSGEA
jgi:two-component system CheB/CheR fusion protein